MEMPPRVRPSVVHCREPHDVYVGRPGPWGNPWSHRESDLAEPVATRSEAIERYAERLRSSPSTILAARELCGLRLGCWCRPAACHGDVIAEAASRPLLRYAGGDDPLLMEWLRDRRVIVVGDRGVPMSSGIGWYVVDGSGELAPDVELVIGDGRPVSGLPVHRAAAAVQLGLFDG